jgi:hypothetical protein
MLVKRYFTALQCFCAANKMSLKQGFKAFTDKENEYSTETFKKHYTATTRQEHYKSMVEVLKTFNLLGVKRGDNKTQPILFDKKKVAEIKSRYVNRWDAVGL